MISLAVFGQNDWAKHENNTFEIRYPKEWKLDTSGKLNSTFILFSENIASDNFNENVNLIIQDLGVQGFTLDSYTKLSEEQIKEGVPESRILSSKRTPFSGGEFHQIIWEGQVGKGKLKFKQHYYIKNGKAYVLTLTTLPDAFDDYIAIGDKILNSFKLK